jgi:hypothetical protein
MMRVVLRGLVVVACAAVQVSGWRRFAGAATYEFAANGYLVAQRDGAGHVIQAQAVYYTTIDTLSRNRLVWRTSGSAADFDGAPPAAPPWSLQGCPRGPWSW